MTDGLKLSLHELELVSLAVGEGDSPPGCSQHGHLRPLMGDPWPLTSRSLQRREMS